jgi:glutamate-ammonia-ligase adenylyltransferase
VAQQTADPEAALRVLDRVAILGLGKLGGAELGFGSDWDAMFVMAESGSHETNDHALRLAAVLVEQMIAAVTSLAPRGMNVELDLRLRPWGRKGGLVQTLRSLTEYHRTSGEMWERQAALKVRHVAGNARVGRRFVSALHQISFARRLSPEDDAAVQAMKRRIETERLKSGTEFRDIKLGHGGLSDIEWLAQKAQLVEGADHPALRTSSTLDALTELEMLDLVPHYEVQLLSDTYLLLSGLRNGLWLRTGQPIDQLPEGAAARSLARLAGYRDEHGSSAEELLQQDIAARMRTVREIFNARFYAPPPRG